MCVPCRNGKKTYTVLGSYLTSYLVKEKDVQSTVDLDVAEVEEVPSMAGLESTPVKDLAGQVMNLLNPHVVSFPDYFSGPQLIKFLFRVRLLHALDVT